jgi:NADH-quinone oxidoreductase subunit L
MEGPTPVSALIHAATMVTAGVYMVTRCNAMFSRAPETMMIVAVIGVATALFAATIGLLQRDIKRVLAYSTVSQLGYMFTALGVGAFVAGIFHLMTHAFFKALLFLGSGSVIRGMHHEQDMMKMGGLKKYMPWTCRTMWVGTAAIAGVPLLSGFFSKDEILWKAFSSGHTGIWLMAWLAAGLTAFYMFRLMFLTFHGEERMDDRTKHPVHESPASMVVPLVVLAVLSVVGGYIGLPAFMGHALHVGNYFEEFLQPVMQLPAAEAGGEHAGELALELLITGLSILIAAAGIYVAYVFYIRNTQIPEKLAASWPRAYEFIYRKYKVDELYDALFVNRAKDLGRGLGSFDHTFVDGAVNGTATTTRFTATISRLFDTYVVDGLVNLIALVSQYLGSQNRLLQSGVIPRYAMAMALGVIVFVGLYLVTG